MSCFEAVFPVCRSQTNLLGLCHAGVLLGYMQEAALLHAAEMGMSRDALLRELGAVWVVHRNSVWLDEPLYPCALRLRTWHMGTRGAVWHRGYAFYEGERLVGRACCAWVVLRLGETPKILRPDALPARAPQAGPVTVEPPAQPRLPADLAPAGERLIRCSDIDVNAHLNNARAADILLDALELNRRPPAFLSQLHIRYAAQVREGERLALSAGEDGEFLYCAADCGARRVLEAAAVLSPLPPGGPA